MADDKTPTPPRPRRTVSRARAAKREANRPVPKRPRSTTAIHWGDSYQNFMSRVGMGTDNQASAGTYGFNPITRLRILLDWAYRGSWLIRACVDAIPEDMTREGIEITGGLAGDDRTKLQAAAINKWQVWDKIKEAMQWARLYGGAGIYMVIDGHDPSSPLRTQAIDKNGLLTLVVLDRWMLNPALNRIVNDPKDPDVGHPEYYDVIADAPIAARQRIHHSRFIRFEGLHIPYYQRLSENFWTISVLEPLYDRITAFDSTSDGAAQLAYKAHLRNYKVKGLRELIAAGGDMYDALIEQMNMVRRCQTNEGMTLMDAEDEYEAFQYTFTGLPELIVQFAQQIAGSEQIPLVRLFGQSPAGLNATGDSDWRNYYDGIKRRQENKLRIPVTRLINVMCASEQLKLEDDFAFEFVPLYQLDHSQRVSVASQLTSTVADAVERGLTTRANGLKELKQASSYTGIWTNITDEEIEDAESEPPIPMGGQGAEGGPPGLEGLLGGAGGAPGGKPPASGKGAKAPAEAKPEQIEADAVDDFLPAAPDNFLPRASRHQFLPKRPFLPPPGEPQQEPRPKPILHVHTRDDDNAA